MSYADMSRRKWTLTSYTLWTDKPSSYFPILLKLYHYTESLISVLFCLTHFFSSVWMISGYFWPCTGMFLLYAWMLKLHFFNNFLFFQNNWLQLWRYQNNNVKEYFCCREIKITKARNTDFSCADIRITKSKYSTSDWVLKQWDIYHNQLWKMNVWQWTKR